MYRNSTHRTWNRTFLYDSCSPIWGWNRQRTPIGGGLYNSLRRLCAANFLKTHQTMVEERIIPQILGTWMVGCVEIHHVDIFACFISKQLQRNNIIILVCWTHWYASPSPFSVQPKSAVNFLQSSSMHNAVISGTSPMSTAQCTCCVGVTKLTFTWFGPFMLCVTYSLHWGSTSSGERKSSTLFTTANTLFSTASSDLRFRPWRSPATPSRAF